MTYGSLFTGIGGIDLGLDRAGFACRWQIENDPYAVKVLEKHWPGVKRYGDIRNVRGNDLEPVDLFCGGFPCQDLSQAGKRAGIEGTRSGLWSEYARLVRELRPRYVLIENVPGLLVSDAMRRVIGELARLGYVGCWRSLRASEFGASHLRKRVFIVAHRSGERRQQVTGRAPGDEAADGREGWDLRQQNGYHVASGEGAGVAYGRDQHVAHARRTGNGRPAEPSGLNRQRPPDHDRGTSGALAHAECPDDRAEISRPTSRDCRSSSALADPINRLLPMQGRRPEGRDGSRPGGTGLRFAPGPSDLRWPSILRDRPDLAPALPQVCGVADGLSNLLDGVMTNRTKRLGRLGNAVVPDCAEWLGRRILDFDLCQTK